MKYRPSASMPSTTSPSPSGRFSRLVPWGMVALNPFAISGVTIMKMIRSTSMMSIIGITWVSDLIAVVPAELTDVPTAAHRLLGLELLREDRAAELAADALDEVVDQLLRRVGHLDREVLDLGGEVVVEPHRGDRDHESERRGDQRLRDTAGDTGQAARFAHGGHRVERGDDTHRGAQQSDERRVRPDRGQHAQAALELRE